MVANREAEYLLFLNLKKFINSSKKAPDKVDGQCTDLIQSLLTSENALSSTVWQTIIRFLIKHVGNLSTPDLLGLLAATISSTTVKRYLKQNDKQLATLLGKYIALDKYDCSVFNETAKVLVSLYSSIAGNETSCDSFLKISLKHIVTAFPKNHGSTEEERQLNHSLQKLLSTLFFSGSNSAAFKEFSKLCLSDSQPLQLQYSKLLHCMADCTTAEVSVENKIELYCTVMRSLLMSDSISDSEVISFLVLIACLLDIAPLPQGIETQKWLQTAPVDEDLAYNIWNELLMTLSKRSINLDQQIGGVNALKWLREMAADILRKPLNDHKARLLSTLIILDSAIVVPVWEEGFSRLSAYQTTKGNFFASDFLDHTFDVFQRNNALPKLIDLLLSSLESAEGNVDELLSASFLAKLTSATVGLPGTQVLSIIKKILSQFEICVNNLETNQTNPVLLSAISSLLTAAMNGCRFISHSTPRLLTASFVEQFESLIKIMRLLSSQVVQRPYDKSLMEAQLQTCCTCIDTNILTSLYGSGEYSDACLPAEEEWSVIVARVANFGDANCKRLLMELLFAKMKIARLGENTVSVLSIATIITNALVKDGAEIHPILSDYSLLFQVLPQPLALSLSRSFYKHADIRSLLDETLLENEKYVESILTVALDALLDKVDSSLEKSKLVLRKHLTEKLTSDPGLKKHVAQALKSSAQRKPKSAESVDEKTSAVLAELPYSSLSSGLSRYRLLCFTGIMATTNHLPLVPIWLRLVEASPDLSDLDLSQCVDWVMNLVVDRTIRCSALQLLLLRATAHEDGMTQFQQLVGKLKDEENVRSTRHLEILVFIYNGLRKCWKTSSNVASRAFNDKIGEQRVILNTCINKAVESIGGHTEGVDIYVVLDLYSIEILRMERLGSIQGAVADNFKDIFGLALKCQTEASAVGLFSTVLKCCKVVKSSLKDESLVWDMWQVIKHQENPEALWINACQAASQSEFKLIVRDLFQQIESHLYPAEKEVAPSWGVAPAPTDATKNLAHFLGICKIFLEHGDEQKVEQWLMMGQRLLSDTWRIMPHSSDSVSFLDWLQFLHFILINPKASSMRQEVENYLLDVLLVGQESSSNFLAHFKVEIDILTSIESKMPQALMIFQRLVHQLSHPHQKQMPQDATDAAFLMEKWIHLLAQKTQHRRFFPLFISKLIDSLANESTLASVKVHLNNCVFALLSGCWRNDDNQHVQHLIRSLPPSHQTLLQTLINQFLKYHRYKGKI